MEASEIARAEQAIDQAFADTKLMALPFAQRIWTLLSVVEQRHFQLLVESPLPQHQGEIFVDSMLNVLTHPLRICVRHIDVPPAALNKKLFNEDFQLASQWLDVASDYNQFCSIFPLWRAGEIELSIVGSKVISSEYSKIDLSSEAYNRFVAKREDDSQNVVNLTGLEDLITSSLSAGPRHFSWNFTGKNLARVMTYLQPLLARRHILPGGWNFSVFSLQQFRSVFTALQAMSYVWFFARQIAVNSGTADLGYESGVWTPKKRVLLQILKSHTEVPEKVIVGILKYLTFGELGIRNPDIAIQPLVDLGNGSYAISTLVLKNVHAERNLCVLLNQIPSERKIYSTLVDEKEDQLRRKIISELDKRCLDFRYGKLSGTDIDLAIIDRVAKKCICIEIKWFIEPAEIREMIDRSSELARGVKQALKIKKCFVDRDPRLFKLLDVDETFDFLTVVGSENFIGRSSVQHPEVPIIKIWHLISIILEFEELGRVMAWLRNKEFLPKLGVDFYVPEMDVSLGIWHSKWYGIAYVEGSKFIRRLCDQLMSKHGKIKAYAKQHFVPQCYMKRWHDPEAPKGPKSSPYVWVFDRDGSRPRNKSPINLFQETDIYTIPLPDGGRNLYLEHGLQELEDKFTRIRNTKFDRGIWPSNEEIAWVLAFVATVRERTASHRDFQKEQWGGIRKRMEEMQEDLKTATPKQLDSMRRIGGVHGSGKDGMTLDQVRRLEELPIQTMMGPVLKTVLPIFSRMHMAVLCTEDNLGFVTTDEPCTWFNPDAHKFQPMFRGPGLGMRNIEVTLPISPKQCLLLTHSDEWRGFIPIEPHVVDELNRRHIGHCDKAFIACRNETRQVWFEDRPLPEDSWEKVRERKIKSGEWPLR